jgi:peptidoglycan/xylan/chitin deacetylase (PgdA/CDA1 family)
MNFKYILSYMAKPLLSSRLKSKTNYLTVIVYHDVPKRNYLNFKQQIVALQKYFYFIDPFHLKNYSNYRVLNGKMPLLLTFDDGFISNYEVAKKVLEPLHIKALFFVTTGYHNCPSLTEQENFLYSSIYAGNYARGSLPDGLKPMTWVNIKELEQNGHMIGAHTINHIKLKGVTCSKQLLEEIQSPKKYLNGKLNTSIDSFAIPFGSVDVIDAKSLKIVHENYKFVFNSVRGLNKQCSKNSFFRQSVQPHEPPNYVLFQAAGGLDLKYYNKRNELRRITAEISHC